MKKIAFNYYEIFLNIIYFLYSRLFNKRIIHVIGDSHARVFRNRKPYIVHHIGPATAHNLYMKGNSTKSNEKLNSILEKINLNRDIVMLVFGEIDCRIHIYNQYMKNNKKFTIMQLIERTITNYGNVLIQIAQMSDNFCVFGIPPTTKQNNIYNYPFYATPEIHSKIYMDFNERMKLFCNEKQIKYIDVYSEFSDRNGFMLEKFNADGVHLNHKIIGFVTRWLDKEIGLNINLRASNKKLHA